MELFEYLYRKKLKMTDLANLIGITKGTVSALNRKKHSCNLLTAAKIIHVSSGEITFQDLMTDEDLDDYKNWLCKQKGISVEFEK